MKIIVIDDDPTGSQTVYGCPLLLRWDRKTLVGGLNHPSPLLFLLANTRAMSRDLAKQRICDISNALIEVCQTEKIDFRNFLLISRGDSTLRGHAILETDILAEKLGPFDATFHIPAFLEGARTTVQGIHFLDGVPVHQTPFANDRIFGYNTSHLPSWLEHKSLGRIPASEVFLLDIHMLEDALSGEKGMKKLIDWILQLHDNRHVVVDASLPDHIMIFATAIRRLASRKRLLFRSAASFISGLANLPVNPQSPSDLCKLRLKDSSGILKPGLITVGSHVELADSQLGFLFSNSDCSGIEVPVKKIANLIESPSANHLISTLERELLQELENVLNHAKTPVLYTSRSELKFSSDTERLRFGLILAEIMARIVGKVSKKLGYLITKGGITTHIILQKGLEVSLVGLKGQILPGLSITSTMRHSKIANLPIVTFPGNLGDAKTLFNAWKLMEDV